MEHAVLWFGFIGAWLLVAGPIYQAAQELLDQDIERERIREAQHAIEVPRRVSPLWWFLPPVKLYLEHRRSVAYRRRFIASLLSEDVEAMISFMSKATAWLMVATGGLCLAIKETYELSEVYKTPLWLMWLIVAGMAFFSVLYTVVSLARVAKITNRTRRTH